MLFSVFHHYLLLLLPFTTESIATKSAYVHQEIYLDKLPQARCRRCSELFSTMKVLFRIIMVLNYFRLLQYLCFMNEHV